jgi:hypothetical protein
LPGAAARPGTIRPAVVTSPVAASLIVALNVRHRPFSFSLPARRECAVNFIL